MQTECIYLRIFVCLFINLFVYSVISEISFVLELLSFITNDYFNFRIFYARYSWYINSLRQVNDFITNCKQSDFELFSYIFFSKI